MPARAHLAAAQSQRTRLFATHYFELTALAEPGSGIANVHLDAVEHGDTLVFMHAVKDGPANRSFGLQVAALAGLPKSVVRQARARLAELEQQGRDAPTMPLTVEALDSPQQFGLFAPSSAALEALAGIEPGRTHAAAGARGAVSVEGIALTLQRVDIAERADQAPRALVGLGFRRLVAGAFRCARRTLGRAPFARFDRLLVQAPARPSPGHACPTSHARRSRSVPRRARSSSLRRRAPAREAFARCPAISTLPVSIACLARLRVLKKRAAHSQRSRRTPGGARCGMEFCHASDYPTR